MLFLNAFNHFLMAAVSIKCLLQANKDGAYVFPQDNILPEAELYVCGICCMQGSGILPLYAKHSRGRHVKNPDGWALVILQIVLLSGGTSAERQSLQKQTSQEADKNLILCCLHFMWWLMLQKCKVSINPNDCIKWEGDTGTKAWKFIRQFMEDPSSKMLKLLHSPVVCKNGIHLSSLEYVYGACSFSSQQCYQVFWLAWISA